MKVVGSFDVEDAAMATAAPLAACFTIQEYDNAKLDGFPKHPLGSAAEAIRVRDWFANMLNEDGPEIVTIGKTAPVLTTRR